MLNQPSPEVPQTSTETVKTSPDGSLDAKDEMVIDAELGSDGEGSLPTAPDTITAVPSSDHHMEVDPEEDLDGAQDGDGDESIDPIDIIDRPLSTELKRLKVSEESRPRNNIKRPAPPGRPISDSTLDAYNNQHQPSRSLAEKPPSKAKSAKPVAVKAERLPDHNIVNSNK